MNQLLLKIYLFIAIFAYGQCFFVNATTDVEQTTISSSIGTTTTVAPFNNDANYIPFEKWYCGATDFDSSLSHQLAEESCTIRMYEANLCCVAHDVCYMDMNKTREECDGAFCFCLKRTVADAARALNTTADGCRSVSDSYCNIVQLFGDAAHQSARALFSSTPMPTTLNITTTNTPTTRTTIPTTTTTTKAEDTVVSTKTPAEIVQFITHNISMHCYEYQLTACVEEMHACVLRHTDENKMLMSESRYNLLSKRTQQALRTEILLNSATFCSNQFCACASDQQQSKMEKIIAVNGSNGCRSSVEMICHEFNSQTIHQLQSLTVDDKGPNSPFNVHFWSIQILYSGYDWDTVSIFIAGFCALLMLIAFAFGAHKLYFICKSKAGRKDLLHMPTPDFIASYARRHTLTKHDCKSGYNAFVEKKTSSSSTDSNGFTHKSNRHHHHHHHHHHQQQPNNNSISTNILKPNSLNITTSSSKTHLISADENSTASTPSINSE